MPNGTGASRQPPVINRQRLATSPNNLAALQSGRLTKRDDNWTLVNGNAAEYNFFKVTVEMK